MGKNVLVMGGSYFMGRVFAMVASKAGYRLTFINRGRYSMSHLENVTEHVCDRTDTVALAGLNLEDHYDAIVDFCAYEPGCIHDMLECQIYTKFDKYIYISTSDVYKRAPGTRKEGDPLMMTKPNDSDDVGMYVYKKACLENELIEESRKKTMAYVILRPAFLYGPYNYAPRESAYIKDIVQNHHVYVPEDANGQFQMVYVKNAAEAIMGAIERPEADNDVFNLSAPEILDYRRFVDALKAVSDIEFEEELLPASKLMEIGAYIPFPLTEEENELFDGSKAEAVLGFQYTPVLEGMKFAYNAFKGVYLQP